jgi:peptidyl-tRNA hydrolase, PTH1 family
VSVATDDLFLIVGLGNIGKEYKGTRHNVGFTIIETLANDYKAEFKSKAKVNGELAQLVIDGKKVYLLKPTTYMNNSGVALRSAIDFFKIKNLSSVLVVVDDIAIPFGELRLKEEGGTGGHKGLLSIEIHLGSNRYSRLRIGVGDKQGGDLISHVLGNFNEMEREELPKIIKKAIEIIHLWLMQGIVVAMNQANIRNKENQK